ncbi:MAG TPA: glycosyltransferase family 39 protein [Terriglobales bacterium]|nr:glycosyltransferase family 39 protein [Terriglobales bacterium]
MWIVLIGFLLRVGFMLAAHTYRPKATDGTFGIGWEMGRIAQSLAEGKGYSSPFQDPTGTTAWEPPAYPFLIAGVFKVFGVYTPLSAIILLTINSAFSALTVLPVFFLALRSFNLKIAKWSAWTWGVFPYAGYWAVKWVWETAITTFLVTVLALITMRLAEGRRKREWALWGALWGVLALTNSSVLSLVPCFGLWVVYQLHRQKKAWFVPAVISGVLFFAMITPWLVRNHRVFGEPVFLRTNLGAELRFGNGPGAMGLWMWYVHPTQNKIEFQRYKEMGELAYVKERKREAMAWIKANPGAFAHATAARMTYFWTNAPWTGWFMDARNVFFFTTSILGFMGLILMWKQRRRAWFVYGAAMLIYPVVYYFVFPHPRYRAPIEPLMAILIVFLISQSSNLQRKHPELRDSEV